MKHICKNPLCNKEFMPRHGCQKYCSKKCAEFMHQYSGEIEKYKDKPCEWCKKDHDHTYGSGRFCSKSCKMSYNASKNRGSEKCKAHLDKLRTEGKIVQKSPYGTWKCNECNLIFETLHELKQHEIDEHNSVSSKFLKGKNKQYACPYCLKEFDTHHQMCGHISNCPNHPNKEQHMLSHNKSGKTYHERYEQGLYKNNGGFGKGSKHSNETKEKISTKRSEQVKNEYLNKFHAKVKWYKISNIKNEEFSVRGTWELNVAKRLNDLGIYWTKAPTIKYFNDFWHNYTADFYIPNQDLYVEVKGRYPDSDRSKMRLVVSQNPEKKIYFIKSKYKDFIEGKIDFDDNLLISNSDL